MEIVKPLSLNINTFLAGAKSCAYCLQTFHIDISWFVNTSEECTFALNNFFASWPVFPSLKHFKIVGFSKVNAENAGLFINGADVIESISIVDCFEESSGLGNFLGAVFSSKLATLKFLCFSGNQLSDLLVCLLTETIKCCPLLTFVELHNARICDNSVKIASAAEINAFLRAFRARTSVSVSLAGVSFNPGLFLGEHCYGFSHLFIINCRFEFSDVNDNLSDLNRVAKLSQLTLKNNKLNRAGIETALRSFLGKFKQIYIAGEPNLSEDDQLEIGCMFGGAIRF